MLSFYVCLFNSSDLFVCYLTLFCFCLAGWFAFCFVCWLWINVIVLLIAG